MRFCYKTLSIYFLFILSASCKKEMQPVLVQDLSLSEPVPLRKVIYYKGKVFVVGGERWTRAFIASVDSQNTVLAYIPNGNGSQSGLYGLSALGDKLIAVGYGGILCESPDRGACWKFTRIAGPKELQQVSMTDNRYIRMVGGISFNKGFIQTINSQLNIVEEKSEDRNFELSDIDMINPALGYVSGYGAILKTTDSGLHWNFTSASGDYFKAMAWKDQDNGVAVGYNGSILYTMDGGEVWQRTRNGNSIAGKKIRFYDVAFDGKHSYMAVAEKGVCLYSNDEGTTWNEVKPFTKEHLYGVCHIHGMEWMVVGENGALFRLQL